MKKKNCLQALHYRAFIQLTVLNIILDIDRRSQSNCRASCWVTLQMEIRLSSQMIRPRFPLHHCRHASRSARRVGKSGRDLLHTIM